MKSLLIDDLRTFEVDTIARTFDEGIEQLQNNKWDRLYLDHDLGDEDEYKTGYGIMCWLEGHTECLPKEIEFVTSNPIGRMRMNIVRNKLYGR